MTPLFQKLITRELTKTEVQFYQCALSSHLICIKALNLICYYIVTDININSKMIIILEIQLRVTTMYLKVLKC